MGIFDALTTAVGGMRSQGFALQNISGNIANSQTTAYKRTDTSFSDLILGAYSKYQTAGNVVANSVSTNSVQGGIQSSSVSTYMAINGDGYFLVAKPEGFVDNKPTFTGGAMYTRRGDFQLNKDGYLVNGAGYYLMGLPVDSSTGNASGSSPSMLQFQNGFQPAQATTEIDYQANLASSPTTNDYKSSVAGSELLNQSNFSANPVVGASANAKIIGSGANLKADAAAVVNGSAALTSLSSTGGSLVINGTTITITAGDNSAAVLADINAQTGTTGVTASLDSSNKLVLTSADAKTNITIGSGSSSAELSELGLSAGTTNATNLLTQSAVSQSQTLTVTVGSNATTTITFGTGGGQVSTLAELNTALSGLAGGTASADSTGNISVAATNTTDTITIGGDATASSLGIHTATALPANGTVIASDVNTFLNESISGGAITTYDSSGNAVNVQMRWAKTDSAKLGSGHSDTWNLFYQTNSSATGTEAAWQNAGTNYTFGSDGKLNPAVNSITLSNVSVDGVSLGDLKLSHGSGGITQFADSSGNAQVNLLQQNGYPAGKLDSVSVTDKGRIAGTYSNGRTIDLAEITLANFKGANGLEQVDGGAYRATADSGEPTFNAAGKIVGSALEGSNTDIADEFTKLIVTQQAYSANTKVITTSNQMVQDLLNMLR
jgi:flagellar hook protein FlgE